MTVLSTRWAPYILPLAAYAVLSCTGCSRRAVVPANEEVAAASAPAAAARGSATALAGAAASSGDKQLADRRVVRTAEVSLEADSPESVARALEELAQEKGGFVLGSETGQTRAEDGEESTSVTVTFRVPVASFDGALNDVRHLGKRVSNERVTGQDVTEDYVDTEAQIRAHRAVEAQYLTVLKDAKSIKDILEVEQMIGSVRTEIDRAEAHRRLLENESSLSSITVHVAKHLDAIDAKGPGFIGSVRQAGHDAAEVSVAIVNGTIRAIGVLAPVAVLLGLPAWLMLRWLLRLRRRPALP